MVEYIIDKPNSSTVTFLQYFEQEFDSFIRKTISNNNAYKTLVVSKILRLENSSKKSNSSVILKTNAEFSIMHSLAFQSHISDYIKLRSKEFDACIPSSQCLLIDIKFEKGEEPKKILDSKNLSENNYYTPITPKYTLDKVILSSDIKQEIQEALNVIHYKQLIYDEWGFGKIDPYPRSILNFYGPPGTGKTMTANAIAHDLGKTILAMNYAEIESKYVGEAPKNLMKAFETAKKFDSVLFFDEADSFLGRRIQNVTHGSDQALNSLRSQMLILLENFDGVVIFATNLVTNFDPAFESRILKHIKFELPNTEARKRIIEGLLPEQLPIHSPITEEELQNLAEITDEFSGREIKGAVLETLLRKATENGAEAKFCFNDFKESFEKKKASLELLKREKTAEKEKKILKALSEMPKQEKSEKETEN